MTLLLAQSDDRMPEFYRAVREQFNQGGTLGSILIVLAALMGLVVLVYVLNRLEQKSTKQATPMDSQSLFRDLVSRLDLSETQREWLLELVKDMPVENPTVLLLSEQLFDNHVREWQGSRRGARPESEKAISKVRARLFPGGAGFVSSADWAR